MELWINDFRHAARSLLRNPSYLAGAAFVLALGIAANALVFTVIHTVLLTPLPYPRSDRLATILEADPDTREGRNPTSPANFADWRRESGSFSEMASAHPWSPVLSGSGKPRQIEALRSSRALFRLLGVAPALGRTFSESEEDLFTAVVSDELWRTEFGGDPAALGRTILLDGEPFTLIGVMPAGFGFPPFWATGARLWAPLDASLVAEASRGARMLRVFGRLADGVELDEAQREMDVIASRLATEFPRANARLTVRVEPLREPVVSGFRSAAWLGWAVAVCIFLIACANTANLSMARFAGKRREMAMRTALGAGRVSLLRRLLAENLWIAMAGWLLGVPLALAALKWIEHSRSLAIPRLEELTFSLPVAGYALGVALLAGLLSGIVPACRGSRADGAWRAFARGTPGRSENRTRSALAVAEISLAIVLLSAAGLLGKSFARLVDFDPGFSTERLLTLDLSLAATDSTSPPRQLALLREIATEAAKLPGVAGAAFINHLHIGGDLWRMSYLAEGEPEPEPGLAPKASQRVITPGLLGAMGIRLVAGREFSDEDRPDSSRVVIVNRTLASRHWPDENPVGRRLRLGSAGPGGEWATIVGVAADVPQQSPARAPLPEIYHPYTQNPVPWFLQTTLAVRTSRTPASLGPAIAEAVAEVNPDLAVSAIRSGRELIGETAGDWRRNALLSGIFSGLATLLAAAGLFGLIHFQVVQWKGETAVRIAVGATRGDILRLVLARGLRVSVLGAALGVVATLLLGRFLESFLFRVAPADPLVLGGVATLMIAVSAAACLGPALRAAHTDPIEVLRQAG